MGKHLKLFETTAAYEAAESGLILPNVSVCLDQPTVAHYNPSSPVPPTPSHDYVEIGGVKWATMNVGATGITDGGLYFQWGDTQGYTASQCGSGEGQKYFGWGDYKYNTAAPSTPGHDGYISKYTTNDGKTILEASDDTAQIAWGDSWRMPTTAEWQALGAAVNSAWTTDYQGSGMAGIIFTDKTDNSKTLFFPAVGSCGNGNIEEVNTKCRCWSSSRYISDGMYAYFVSFGSSGCSWQLYNSRYYGFAVRPVAD